MIEVYVELQLLPLLELGFFVEVMNDEEQDDGRKEEGGDHSETKEERPELGSVPRWFL